MDDKYQRQTHAYRMDLVKQIRRLSYTAILSIQFELNSILIGMNMDPQGLLRNLIRNNNHPTQLLSMPHHLHPELRDAISSLPNQLKKIFAELFNPNKAKITFSSLLPFKLKQGKLPSCNVMLSSKDQSYRCFDCQIHPESLLCQECFQRGHHLDHRYIRVKNEGSCDCGNKNILKQSAFCPHHQGQEQILEIDSSQQFMFNLYVRQMFIWILKLFKIGQQKDGQNLLFHFIEYLSTLNDGSLYYNKLTTNMLFSDQNPIVDHLFYISINAAGRSKLSQSLYSLFCKMLLLRDFKEKLLISLVHNYNKIDNFQSCKYVKLFNPLLNQTSTVVSAMEKCPIALRPERQFSIQAYYNHLSMIKDIQPQAARAFLSPLLMVDAIRFPFLETVQALCQKKNDLIVTVFPEFQKQEFAYYKLLMAVIKVIEDKLVLAAMMKNYVRMIQQYSFKRNKIILVPQRILVLLIYKYFQFNTSLVQPSELASILQLKLQEFDQLIYQTYFKFIQCIFSFSANLNRSNYFENYLSVYIKESSQIICIDHLGLKIFPLLTSKALFHQALNRMYTCDSIEGYNEEERTDLLKTRNIFLKSLVEVICSDRTQLIVSSMLGRQHPLLVSTLDRVFQSTGEISHQELQAAAQVFNYNVELRREVLDEVLHLDPVKKKLIVNRSERSKGVHLELMVSLLQTKFSKFVNRTYEFQECQLSEQQQQLKSILLNCQMLEGVVLKQLVLIQAIQDYKLMIKQLLRTLNNIKIAYGQQEAQFNHLYLIVLDHVQHKYSQRQDNDKLLQEIDYILTGSKQSQPQENKKEMDRKKQLLRLKKQQVMKSKKIKENQEKFRQQESERVQSEQICLICRESSHPEQMCYMAKVNLNSLLYDCMQIKRDHLIFKTCYHTVHYECFIKMDKVKESAFCPLCKAAINILLPLEHTKQNVMKKIIKRIEDVLMYFLVSKEGDNGGLILEGVCFIANVLISNSWQWQKLGDKHRRVLKVIYRVIEHSLMFKSRQQQAQINLVALVNQQKSLKSKIYLKLVQLLFQLCSTNNHTNTINIIQQASNLLGTQQTKSIVETISHIISLPGVSELEPLLIEMQNLKQIDPQHTRYFYDFWTPPPTVEGLLKLRQTNSKQSCKIGHQICVCVMCHNEFCLTCKKTSNHVRQKHARECLFFNTSSGGLFYFYKGVQLAIRCLYTNDLQKIWKPEFKVDGFVLDSRLYKEILSELKGGSLFSYFVSTFQGLKSGNIPDRI